MKLIFLFLFYLTLSFQTVLTAGNTNSRRNLLGCTSTIPVNVIFAIDQSETNDFVQQLSILSRIVEEQFNDISSFGIIQFGARSIVTDTLQPSTKKLALSRLKQISQHHLNSQFRNIPKMLKQALTQFDFAADPNAEQILIVLTNGNACLQQCECFSLGCSICPNGLNDNPSDIWGGAHKNINEAISPSLWTRVRQSKMRPIFIGFGAEDHTRNFGCLLKHNDDLFTVTSFTEAEITPIVSRAAKFTCQTIVTQFPTFSPTTPSPKCASNLPLNIVFAFDQSTSLGSEAFQNQVNYVKWLVATEFNNNLNAGFIQFGTFVSSNPILPRKNVEILHFLNYISYWPEDRNRLRIQYTNTEEMLETALQMFSASAFNSDQNNVLIVFTDGDPCTQQCGCQLHHAQGCALCPFGSNPINSQTHSGTNINSAFSADLWQRIYHSDIKIIFITTGKNIDPNNFSCMLKNYNHHIPLASLTKPHTTVLTQELQKFLCSISAAPTKSPSRTPTLSPSARTKFPSGAPSSGPTIKPTSFPTMRPSTISPTSSPSQTPTLKPSKQPTFEPVAKVQCNVQHLVDVIFIIDDSCGISETQCNVLFSYVTKLIQKIINPRMRVGVIVSDANAYSNVIVPLNSVFNDYSDLYRLLLATKCTPKVASRITDPQDAILNALNQFAIFSAQMPYPIKKKIVTINSCVIAGDSYSCLLKPKLDELDIKVINVFTQNNFHPLCSDKKIACLNDFETSSNLCINDFTLNSFNYVSALVEKHICNANQAPTTPFFETTTTTTKKPVIIVTAPFVEIQKHSQTTKKPTTQELIGAPKTQTPTGPPVVPQVKFLAACSYEHVPMPENGNLVMTFNINVKLCNTGEFPIRNITVKAITKLSRSGTLTKTRTFDRILGRNAFLTESICAEVDFVWNVKQDWTNSPTGRSFVMFEGLDNSKNYITSNYQPLYNGQCSQTCFPNLPK